MCVCVFVCVVVQVLGAVFEVSGCGLSRCSIHVSGPVSGFDVVAC